MKRQKYSQREAERLTDTLQELEHKLLTLEHKDKWTIADQLYHYELKQATKEVRVYIKEASTADSDFSGSCESYGVLYEE